MDKNVEVALKLGWTRCYEKYIVHCRGDGDHWAGHWLDETKQAKMLPDYEHDIAAAMTIVGDQWFQLSFHPQSLECPWTAAFRSVGIIECGATASAAIVDAFLAVKGGE